ncbi:MAG: NTP transferase domain-containing protein [Actinomycetota bacterium]|nr:NTP transferase domain-containing protein [Actinomycetota bacterium]
MAYRPVSAVLLAAGEGTRMHSSRPKPLHRLCGRPMVLHVLDALAELPVREVVVVVGHRGDWVTKTLSEHAPSTLALSFVEQAERLGTADALAVGLTALSEELVDADGDVVVLPGDTPLVRPATLVRLVREHRLSEAAATLVTARVDDATGSDRVVRGKAGAVVRIDDPSVVSSAAARLGGGAEAGMAEDDGVADAGAGRACTEVATTIHCFRLGVLAPALRRIAAAGDPAEHRLTDVYEVLASAGYRVESVTVDDPMEAAGVNDRAQLAVAEAELRARINDRWMRQGVTMWDPSRTYVDAGVELAPDVVLLPGVVLQGACRIGSGAEIGPDCHLVDTVVGAGATVRQSSGVGAVVGAGACVGPFACLSAGAAVADGAVVAAFVELGGPAPAPAC